MCDTFPIIWNYSGETLIGPSPSPPVASLFPSDNLPEATFSSNWQERLLQFIDKEDAGPRTRLRLAWHEVLAITGILGINDTLMADHPVG